MKPAASSTPYAAEPASSARLTNSGPRMKQLSTTTDSTANADCRCDAVMSALRYMARMTVETGGKNSPATNALPSSQGRRRP